MKNIILVIFILLQTSFLFSQGNEIIINDDSQYGFSRPRIALLDNDIPFVLWGKTGGSPKVYGANLVGANFSTPVQIVPDSMRPRVGG